MTFSHSSLRYGLAALLLLVPNIAFARGGEFPLIFIFIIYGGLLLIPIVIFLYSCNSVRKNKWSQTDKTLHISLSTILFFVIFGLSMYLWDHIYYSFLYDALNLDTWTYEDTYEIKDHPLILFILIASYISPKLACKIIK